MGIVGKQRAEQVIGEHYHSEWKKSYLGTLWENLAIGDTFEITSTIRVERISQDQFIVWCHYD